MGGVRVWVGCGIYIYIYVSKIVTFINMVIVGVENWSPDMIPVAFEGNFDENLNEIPPGIYRPHIVEFVQYWGWED